MIDGRYVAILWDITADKPVDRRDFQQISQIKNLCPKGKPALYYKIHQVVCLDKQNQDNLETVRTTFFNNNPEFLPPETVSPDGALWAVGGYNSNHVDVDVYSIADNNFLDHYQADNSTLFSFQPEYSLAFSPNAALLAVGEDSGKVTVWQIKTNQLQYSCDAAFQVKDLAFSPDNQKLALIDKGHRAIMDLTAPGCTITYPKTSSEVSN